MVERVTFEVVAKVGESGSKSEKRNICICPLDIGIIRVWTAKDAQLIDDGAYAVSLRLLSPVRADGLPSAEIIFS